MTTEKRVGAPWASYLLRNKYRVVRDTFLGYEVQIRRWWFPFWAQCWGASTTSNTHRSLAGAEAFAASHKASAAGTDVKEPYVVKVLDA